MSDEVLIQLEHVVKTLGGRRILDGLNWELGAGECAVILGPSGAGKTVFLHTLLGFLAPDAGRVLTPGLPGDRFESIAVMFQEDALIETGTVEANLAMAVEERADLFHGPFEPRTDEAIDAVLREVQLDPTRVRAALPSTLSGGMRRRVALARALIRQPRILIADEPTTGLDPSTSKRVYDLLGELIQRRGMSAVMITHDPTCASRLGFPVYFFSPIEGRMPRWPAPDSETPYEERHKSLLVWMAEQIDAHIQRQNNNETAERPPDADAPPFDFKQESVETFHQTVDALGRKALLADRLWHKPSPVLLTRNLLQWGAGTLPLSAMIFLMLGVVMQVQAETALLQFGRGFSDLLPELVALSLLRLSPILTGFLMAGRCGSAIGAQIGWMQLGGQFRALRTLRIEPDRVLFAPLFWSLVISAPLLALSGLFFGALGAVLAMVSPLSHADLTLLAFWDNFPQSITAAEVAVLMLKSILMGAGLAVIAYAGGAGPKRSPAEVTSAITRGLVLVFIWVALVDTLVSLLIPV